MRQAYFALLLSAASLMHVAAAEELPISYFTRHDDTGDLKISPDGEYYAMTTRFNGAPRLSFLDVATMKTGVAIKVKSTMEIQEFTWISPTRVVYTLGRRHLKRMFPTGEMAAIDRDGKDHTWLAGWEIRNHHFGTMLNALDDDDRRILVSEGTYVSEGTHVALVDTYRATYKDLETLPLIGASIVLDDEERIRFASGVDEDVARPGVMWRPTGAGDWVPFAPPGFMDESVFPQRFAPDGKSVYFLGTRQGETVNALYRYDLETGSVEKLYQHDTYDIEFLIPDFADRDVAGVRVYAVKPEYHWLDPENATAKTYGELQRAFPGQSLIITSVTDDERIAIVYVWSDTNPGDYYKLDRSARKVDYIMPSRGWVDPAKMSHVEAVAFQARDGVALHGYLTRPKDAPGPYPLIVLPHGGPHLVRDTWEFDPEVQLLAHYGYAVLQVNFRGSGGYGLPFSQSGYRQWGATMQDDITDATRWAVAQGITTDDNICIYGSSFGGYAALMGAAREPTLYRCAAGGFGIYDLELMFERGDTQASEWGEEYLEDVLGTDPESLRARSPVYLADRIQAAVLLIHGQEDWRADISHATRMRSALEKAGKNVTWLALSGEGHGISNEANREETYGTLLAFFGKHLRQSAPSSTSREAATGGE